MSVNDNVAWGDYEGWQNYFARFDRQDNEWGSSQRHQSQHSYLSGRKVGEGLEKEGVISAPAKLSKQHSISASQLAIKLKEAWDGYEIESLMSKSSQALQKIAWRYLSDREKTICNALLNDYWLNG